MGRASSVVVVSVVHTWPLRVVAIVGAGLDGDDLYLSVAIVAADVVYQATLYHVLLLGGMVRWWLLWLLRREGDDVILLFALLLEHHLLLLQLLGLALASPDVKRILFGPQGALVVGRDGKGTVLVLLMPLLGPPGDIAFKQRGRHTPLDEAGGRVATARL